MAKSTQNTVNVEELVAKAVAQAVAAAMAAAPQQNRQMTTAKPSNVVKIGGNGAPILLVFDGKPSEKVRTAMKQADFIFNPKTKNWLCEPSDRADRLADRLVSGEYEG